MANLASNQIKLEAFTGGVDVLTATIKVSLHTSTLTPDADTHKFYSDLTNEAPATGGYTTGGATLAGKSATIDTTNDRGVFDATDVTWASSTISSVRYACVYESTGTGSTSTIIGFIDFASDKSSAGTDFVIQFHADGIAYIG